MMKISSHVAVTAIGLVLLAAGVLAPLGSTISEVQLNLETLKAQTGPVVSAQAEIEVMMQRITEVESAIAQRPVRLCPATSEAANAFEAAVADEVRRAGMKRVSMDRRPGTPIGGLSNFEIDLSVEGTASQLHALLVGLESLPWINRVLRVELRKGQAKRLIDLRIAALQESES